MSNQELEQAYDPSCELCITQTVNSSDGGKLPCRHHKLMFSQRTYPVIHSNNLWGGEWTHTEVTTQGLNDLLIAIVEAYEEVGSRIVPADFIDNLGISVIQMTKDEIKVVPEL
jgi:hypothetical protein